jgi:hypothetical protein
MEFSMRKLGIALLLLLTMPLTVVADDADAYWGAMLGKTDYDDPSVELSLLSFTGRLGYEFGKFLSVEGRVMFSGAESKAGVVDDLKIDYLGNVSAKLNIPFGEAKRVNLYGVVGYSSYKISYNSFGTDTYFTDDGASYGVGIDFFADNLNGINIEWLRYADSTVNGVDYTLDSFAIGYVRRF